MITPQQTISLQRFFSTLKFSALLNTSTSFKRSNSPLSSSTPQHIQPTRDHLSSVSLSTYLKRTVCFYVLKVFLKKFKYFYFSLYFKLIFFLVFSDHFDVLMSKVIVFLKNIILMSFRIKNTLKSNCNNTLTSFFFITNNLNNS